jgi:hypothetical protein
VTEETKPIPPEAEAPEAKRSSIYDLIQSLRGGKLDPITAMLLISEMRRQDREDERWMLERQRLLQPQPNPSSNKEVDVEEIIRKMNETWERRFLEYQSNIEKLILGRQLEETKAKLEKAEAELKEKAKTEEQRKMMEEAVQKVRDEYESKIADLRAKLEDIPKGERDSFMDSLMAEIGDEFKSEVRDLFLKRLRGEEEPITVDKEGKMRADVVKLANRAIRVFEEWVKTRHTPPRLPIARIPIPQPGEMPPEAPPPETMPEATPPAPESPPPESPPPSEAPPPPESPPAPESPPPESASEGGRVEQSAEGAGGGGSEATEKRG